MDQARAAQDLDQKANEQSSPECTERQGEVQFQRQARAGSAAFLWQRSGYPLETHRPPQDAQPVAYETRFSGCGLSLSETSLLRLVQMEWVGCDRGIETTAEVPIGDSPAPENSRGGERVGQTYDRLDFGRRFRDVTEIPLLRRIYTWLE